MNRFLVACGLIASVLIGAVLVLVIEAALAMRMRRTKVAHKPEQQLGEDGANPTLVTPAAK